MLIYISLTLFFNLMKTAYRYSLIAHQKLWNIKLLNGLLILD